MIKYTDLKESYKGVVFELDNVLFPERDYDLQVFYLFANFIEYLEQFPPATDVIEFMRKRYEVHGKKAMFNEVQQTFGIEDKYRENLDRLFLNAKLPLKLLLYKESLELLQELVVNRKLIFILTKGKAEGQLNKIKQIEWNGLGGYLKVYFLEEYNDNFTKAFDDLLSQNQLEIEDLCFVGATDEDKEHAVAVGVDYISARR